MRRRLLLSGLIALAGIGLTVAWASTFVAGPLILVSTNGSPFSTCTADSGQPGKNFPDAEVEPWVDVNPHNPLNLAGAWQQDRWSNGGARGLLSARSTDGGATWLAPVMIPDITVCSGGTEANGGDFLRASDPWLSFAPNGDLYHVSLSFDLVGPPEFPGAMGKNGVLVSKSTDGGATWGAPITIIRDTDPRFFNDKESVTADLNDSRGKRVYVVWDRVKVPTGALINPERVIGFGFKGPAMLSRTTDGGQTWEPARVIFDPGANKQTIANQIVVLPNGHLVDVFNEILNQPSRFVFNVAVIRSTDHGQTWTHGQAIHVAALESRAAFDPQQTGVRDPDTNARLRTGDIIPEIAVDRTVGSTGGNLYVVWQDSRFSNFTHDSIAFSMSTDGGFTWSAPIQINQTPTTGIRSGDQQAFTPAIRVATDGTIGVTYYDFRNNVPCPIGGNGKPDCTGVPLSTDAFIVHCHAATVSCADPLNWQEIGSETRLTPVSFNMREAPVARGFFVGDYEGLTVVGTEFKPFFVQSGTAVTTTPPTDVYSLTVGP
jgi:hypothetical protein